MKSLIATICILGLVGMVVGAVAQGVEETLTATVCPELISLTVSPDSVDYGTQTLGATNLVPTPPSVTIQNTGNVAEDFLVKGDDAATAGGTWALVSSITLVDQYVHKSSPDNVIFTALTKSNATLTTNISGETNCAATANDGGTQALYLKMDIPSSSTVQGQYSAPVVVTAIATP